MNVDAGSSVRHAPRWPQHRRARWPAAAATIYLAVTATVAVAEYVSEMSKISRGTYTDTFSPFLFTTLLTLPVSAAHSAWHGYPVRFSAIAYRHAVDSGIAPAAVNIVATAVVIFGVAMIWTYVLRRRHV